MNVYEANLNESEWKTCYIVTLFATNPTCTGLGSFRRHDEEQCDMRDERFSMKWLWR